MEKLVRLPSVREFLHLEQERAKAVFTKPMIGKELEALSAANDGLWPQAGILSLQLMTLKENTVIPVHVHQEKEKIYVFYGPGTLDVGMILEDGSIVYSICASTQPLAVPAGTPHFIKFFSSEPMVCKTLVISSSQNSADIQWEDEADELIKNKR